MTYCISYLPEVSRQLRLLLPMNRLKIYWPFPGNLLENLCCQTTVFATVQDTKGLFQYNERLCWKHCDIGGDVLLLQGFAMF